MSICIIPARGGSKRILRKNVREFCGKPMIAWSIHVALQSGCFDKVVVSTDDDEIAHIAKENGAEVPFRRSAELADDQTPTVPVIADAIKQLGGEYSSLSNRTPVCCLYATAPFVDAADLCSGSELLRGSDAPYVIGVTTYAFPIQRALRYDPSHGVEMFDPSKMHVRSQDLEEAWHDAGQFYWGRAGAWSSGLGVFSRGVQAIQIPRHRVQDIDTEEDWHRAELMMQAMINRGPT